MKTNAIISVIILLVLNFSVAQAQNARTTYRSNTTTRVVTQKDNASKTSATTDKGLAKTQYLPINGLFNPYVGARGGIDLDGKPTAGAMVGVRISAIRLEGEFMWHETNSRAMALGYLDLAPRSKTSVINKRTGRTETREKISPFQPFIVAGIGAGKQVIDLKPITETGGRAELYRRFGLEWCVGAGISFRVAPHIMLDLSYKFTGLSKETHFINNLETITAGMSESVLKDVNATPLQKNMHFITIGFRWHK